MWHMHMRGPHVPAHMPAGMLCAPIYFWQAVRLEADERGSALAITTQAITI